MEECEEIPDGQPSQAGKDKHVKDQHVRHWFLPDRRR
jgi:hypothetical protein